VAAAVALMALIATLAKSPQQAAGYASFVTVVLGLFGGTFFPISQASFLGTLTLLAPQAWMMRGFQDLAAGGTVADIAPSLIALAIFTIVTGSIAVARSRMLIGR
jgi:ABC-2 type transport system permease protein